MDIIFLANKVFAAGTVLAQLALVLLVVCYVAKIREHKVLAFLKKYALHMAFAVSLLSMGASLFYSNIAGFPPCDLCWFQRIFMYPIVFVLGLGLFKKDSNAADYGLVLAIIGFVIAVYHNFLYYSAGGLSVFCDFAGSSGVSCVKRYVFEFGYVTIPMMAATAFLVVIALLVLARKREAAQ